MRLQKFLAQAGIASRRKAEVLIETGAVKVNGKQALLGSSIDPQKDQITINGKSISTSSYYYFALHKPAGFLSTVTDPFKRKTVLDLVKTSGRVYPVGRLDQNSEGLMILTNDGELAYRLTHPKFHVEKIYAVLVKGIPSKETLKKLEGGILLEDGKTAPCEVRITKILEGKTKCALEIKLYEGRKREIRRMMKAVGHPAISLCRTRIGPLALGDLPKGKSRPLSAHEVMQLKNAGRKC